MNWYLLVLLGLILLAAREAALDRIRVSPGLGRAQSSNGGRLDIPSKSDLVTQSLSAALSATSP